MKEAFQLLRQQSRDRDIPIARGQAFLPILSRMERLYCLVMQDSLRRALEVVMNQILYIDSSDLSTRLIKISAITPKC